MSERHEPEPVTVYCAQPCAITMNDLRDLHRRITQPEDLDDALLAVAVENTRQSLARELDAQFWAQLFPTKVL